MYICESAGSHNLKKPASLHLHSGSGSQCLPQQEGRLNSGGEQGLEPVTILEKEPCNYYSGLGQRGSCELSTGLRNGVNWVTWSGQDPAEGKEQDWWVWSVAGSLGGEKRGVSQWPQRRE